ncbi:hypothetical protein PUV54_00010 [Hyphococcus flavus]|uniref:Uncharacterized protein n=1 Tax=Hyphococcus flavus TaxID=1866326 RepID=A0AAE9ZF65_9PROT|nr:hypothetical protein [Hyphococcus flavus]WDI31577.1 hypothetical protein PUV54_00010 [Hyphococcus flavus]
MMHSNADIEFAHLSSTERKDKARQLRFDYLFLQAVLFFLLLMIITGAGAAAIMGEYEKARTVLLISIPFPLALLVHWDKLKNINSYQKWARNELKQEPH